MGGRALVGAGRLVGGELAVLGALGKLDGRWTGDKADCAGEGLAGSWLGSVVGVRVSW
jgi:hypothetical protein